MDARFQDLARMSSKTKNSVVKEDAMTALVPKLRFPEFRETENWKSVPLNHLERLTQPIYEPRADDGSGQCEQSLVNIKPPFETNSELAKPSKPRMGAFDNPAVFS